MLEKTALLAEDGFPNDRICQDPNNFHTGFLNFPKIEYVEYSYFFSFSAFLKCLQSCSLSGCDQGVMEDLLFLSAKTPHNAPTWPDQTPEKTSEISKERFAFGFFSSFLQDWFKNKLYRFNEKLWYLWFLSVSFPWNNWMWRNIIQFWIQMFGFESFHVYFLSLAIAATGCCMQIGKQCWTSWKSLWNFRLHTRQDLWRLICRSNQIAFHSSCHRIQKSPIINAANPPVSKVFGLDDILSPGLRAWRTLYYIYKYLKA